MAICPHHSRTRKTSHVPLGERGRTDRQRRSRALHPENPERHPKTAHLSLATNHGITGGGEHGKEVTYWRRPTCWNQLPQFVEEHVPIGDRV